MDFMLKRILIIITAIFITIRIVPHSTDAYGAHSHGIDTEYSNIISEEIVQDVEQGGETIEQTEQTGQTIPTENIVNNAKDEETLQNATSEQVDVSTEPTEILEQTEIIKPTKPNEPESTPEPSVPYIGNFQIESVGINVKCYDSHEQYIVDKKNSAAYFYGFGHYIIADHKNQGFDAIKSCSIGTTATLTTENGIQTFVCIDKIKGHNTGKYLTDETGVSISEYHEGALVCYTCNENWQNITIVFFAPENETNSENSQDDNSTQGTVVGCENEIHKWSKPKFEWGGELENGKTFYWESRVCSECADEEWQIIYNEDSVINS